MSNNDGDNTTRADLELFKTLGKELVVGSFMRYVIHELNNKMGPILLYSELLQSNLEQETMRKHLRTIEQTTIEARDILNTLQMFVRKTSGKTIHANVKHDLEEVLGIINFQLKKKDVTVEMEVESDLPPVTLDSLYLVETLFLMILRAYLEIGSTGGEIKFTVYREQNNVCIDMKLTPIKIAHADAVPGETGNNDLEYKERIECLMNYCKELIVQSGGKCDFEGILRDGSGTGLCLPVVT